MTAQYRKRLAYLTTRYPAISHSFIRREILALERQGWEIHRFAPRGWNAELTDAEDFAEFDRTTHILKHGPWPLLAATARVFLRFPVRFAAALGLAFRLMWPSDRPFPVHLVYLMEACWLARELESRNIRHLHAHFGMNPAEVGMLVCKLSGISYSFTAHGTYEFDKAPLLHLAEKTRHAAFVACVSSYGRSQLYRNVDLADYGKIHVIHCGVDKRFVSEPTSSACMAPRLVWVGRLCKEKGLPVLMGATAQLKAEGRAFELVLVGDGEMRPDIESYVKRNGLQKVVTITGWADGAAVRREILASRAMVLPSFAEGLPVVLMEAMSLGRPVLSTYIAGIPELVTDGESGWLVPAGDQDALADAMRTCLDADNATLERLGLAARRRAKDRHEVDCEAAKLSKLFETALLADVRS